MVIETHGDPVGCGMTMRLGYLLGAGVLVALAYVAGFRRGFSARPTSRAVPVHVTIRPGIVSEAERITREAS